VSATPAELALVVLAALAAGIVDAVAGGGGLVTLPALVAVGLPLHAAIATNKGQAVFGAASSFATYARGGAVDRDRIPAGLTFGFVGSMLGAALLLAVRPGPLRPAVIALLVFAGAAVVLRGRVAPLRRRPSRPQLLLAAFALGLGAYDGFFGPGMGSLLIVGFVLLFGDTLTRASGNAKVVNFASNLAAFGLFAWKGVIVWRLALPMAGANMAGAFVGAHLALSRGDRLVRIALIVVVTGAVAKLALAH